MFENVLYVYQRKMVFFTEIYVFSSSHSPSPELENDTHGAEYARSDIAIKSKYPGYGHFVTKKYILVS